ncbi:MAG: hypothetical protein K6F39_08800 [Lachnospiraceae bacterium]|nr:hypothetical protein [Lachnospiraceae bacterium]
MNDTYVECLVSRKPNPAAPLIRSAAYGFTAAFLLFGLLFQGILFLILGAAGAAACYFLLPALSVEYEYLYVSREFSVDRIIGKEKRKTVYDVTMDKMELFAEEGAYQLDQYKNIENVHDFSSGEKDARRFIMVLRNSNASEKLILEASDELVDAIRNVYPSKVFLKK